MKNLMKKLRRSEKGQTATEYMLIVAVLVTVVIAGAAMFGDNIKAGIDGLSGRVRSSLDTACTDGVCP